MSFRKIYVVKVSFSNNIPQVSDTISLQLYIS